MGEYSGPKVPGIKRRRQVDRLCSQVFTWRGIKISVHPERIFSF